MSYTACEEVRVDESEVEVDVGEVDDEDEVESRSRQGRQRDLASWSPVDIV
jgi:hypothetical protein